MSKKTVKHKQYYNFFYKILQEKRTVIKQSFQTVDKTLLVSTPEAFFLFWVQKVCT